MATQSKPWDWSAFERRLAIIIAALEEEATTMTPAQQAITRDIITGLKIGLHYSLHGVPIREMLRKDGRSMAAARGVLLHRSRGVPLTAGDRGAATRQFSFGFLAAGELAGRAQVVNERREK